MSLIGRLFVIFFAVMLASMAAAVVIAFGILNLPWDAVRSDPLGQFFVWSVALFASGAAMMIGFLPLLCAIAVAEIFSIRSLLVYAAAGAAMMALGAYAAGLADNYEESIDTPPRVVNREVELAAAAGAVFGLVYWLVAGRRAGAWRRMP